MSETDPFSDAAFNSRLNKLLPMLGSAQAGEADNARRKLVEHLSQHRLSFTDLAQRLRDGAERSSFVNGGRELSLERQLAIARAAKQEASAEAIAASLRAHGLEVDLQQAAFESARMLASLSQARTWAAAGWIVAAVTLTALLVPKIWPANRNFTDEALARSGAAALQPPDPFAADGGMRLGPGEMAGEAAVQDLPIRLNPNEDANVRAFLNRGERVIIQNKVREGQQTWLLIRSATGAGWVRAGDVIH